MKKILSIAIGAPLVCLGLSGVSYAQATGFAGQNGGTTGGQGGPTVSASTGTEIHQALCSRPSSDSPIIIEVRGTINHGNTSKVSGSSCNTAADKIEIKDVANISLVGVGSGALFDQLGIHVRNSSNIIIRNVKVRNVKKSGSPISNGGDAIGMESDVSNVWVDHVTLTADGGESDGYDALIDIKANTKYVTLSYSHLEGSDRGGLVGSSSSDLNNGPITWHHNIFRDLNSRVPLLRGGFAHLYNNWYDGIRSTGVNSRRGGKALIENNYFEDSKNPIGTFFDDVSGTWDLRGNIFDNIEWKSSDSESPAGPNPQPTESLAVPYGVNLDDAGCLPALLAQIAGADKGLRTSDGNCSAPNPNPNPNPNPDPDPSPDDNELQASEASLNQASVESNHSGYTGAGFINFDNNSLSGASWTINSADSGDGSVVIRYANGGDGTRPMTLTVNGGSAQAVNFAATGSWSSWTDVVVAANGFVSGNNTIALSSANPVSGPNIDGLTVTLPGGSSNPDPDPNPGNGTNLSIGAGSDGSSKASGSSYGNVRDGNLSTYWSPTGSTGRISVKWSSAQTINTVVIREASGYEGRVGSWRLVNNDTGSQLANGSGAGAIEFGNVSLDKVDFFIDGASGQPRIAEFETYQN